MGKNDNMSPQERQKSHGDVYSDKWFLSEVSVSSNSVEGISAGYSCLCCGL